MSTLILPTWLIGSYLKVGGIITATTVSVSSGIIFTTVEKKQPFLRPFINTTGNLVKDSLKNYVSLNPDLMKTVKSSINNVGEYINDVPKVVIDAKDKVFDLKNQAEKQITNIPQYLKKSTAFLTDAMEDSKIKEYTGLIKQQLDYVSEMGKNTTFFFENTLMGYGKDIKQWLDKKWDTKQILQHTGNIFTTIHQKPKDVTKTFRDSILAIWKEKITLFKFVKWLDAEKMSILWDMSTWAGNEHDEKIVKKTTKTKKITAPVKKTVSEPASSSQVKDVVSEAPKQNTETPTPSIPIVVPQQQTTLPSSQNTQSSSGTSREGDPE